MGLKEAYQEKIEAQIKEWTARVQEYKAKADKASADIKIQMYQQIDRLRAQKEAAQQKLDEIKAASGDSWETLKAGSEKALDEVRKTWETLISKFK
ncbi:MAG: coiled coil domain-containing protein [Thermodesulfobacteriota bacterium]